MLRRPGLTHKSRARGPLAAQSKAKRSPPYHQLYEILRSRRTERAQRIRNYGGHQCTGSAYAVSQHAKEHCTKSRSDKGRRAEETCDVGSVLELILQRGERHDVKDKVH